MEMSQPMGVSGLSSLSSSSSRIVSSILWAYRPLPYLFLVCFLVWCFLVGLWIFNTWSKRHCQQSRKLQVMLTVVPIMKALVLALSFTFWYSCIHIGLCSFWVAFGVFVTRIFMEIACFVSFLLIAHGYCIMHEELAPNDRRAIAGLVSLLYLSLTGYKAAVPQFGIFMMIVYAMILYMIFLRISKNIALLKEQLHHIEDNGIQVMRPAILSKYIMFRKFQTAMFIMVVTEILTHMKTSGIGSVYWVHLLIRESTEIGILFYIGWTFRSQELSPYFTLTPSDQIAEERIIPPMFSIEMNERDFKALNFREWHIGVRTSHIKHEEEEIPLIVVVQHPSPSRTDVSEISKKSKELPDFCTKSLSSSSFNCSAISSSFQRTHSIV